MWLPLVIPSSSGSELTLKLKVPLTAVVKPEASNSSGSSSQNTSTRTGPENGRDELTESCTTPVSWKLVPATTVVGVDGSNTTELNT